MSLAIRDKQLNLAFVPSRSTLGTDHLADEVYLRGRLARNRNGGLTGRRPEKDRHARESFARWRTGGTSSKKRNEDRPSGQPYCKPVACALWSFTCPSTSTKYLASSPSFTVGRHCGAQA